MRSLKIVKKLSKRLRFLTALFVLFSIPLQSHAQQIVDATGTSVTLKSEKPSRIVTLAPSLGELAADFLGNDLKRIVGVSEYTDYPAALKKIESIGAYHRFNLEKVVALKPDLVLATTDGNPKDQVTQLRSMGIPVVVVNTQTLSQVSESIRLISKAMGSPDAGERMAAQLQKGIERIHARSQVRPKKRVLLQIGEEPLIVVGKESFLHEALETVGAQNVYADLKAHYPRPAVEDAVHRNPDVILVLALGQDLTPFQKMAISWQRFPHLKAVSQKETRVLQGDTILRPTLRLLEGLSLLERAVYGAP